MPRVGGWGGTQGKVHRTRPHRAGGLGERLSGWGHLPDTSSVGNKQGCLGGSCDGGSGGASHARRTLDEAVAPTRTTGCPM